VSTQLNLAGRPKFVSFFLLGTGEKRSLFLPLIGYFLPNYSGCSGYCLSRQLNNKARITEGKQTAIKAMVEDVGIASNGPTNLIKTDNPRDRSRTLTKNAILLSIDGIV